MNPTAIHHGNWSGPSNPVSISYVAARRQRSKSRSSGSGHAIVGSQPIKAGSIITVPVVKTDKIFLSRVAPSYSARDIWLALQKLVRMPLKVHRLQTKYNHYASFILVCDPQDTSVLLDPGNWSSGALIIKDDRPLRRSLIMESFSGEQPATAPHYLDDTSTLPERSPAPPPAPANSVCDPSARPSTPSTSPSPQPPFQTPPQHPPVAPTLTNHPPPLQDATENTRIQS